MDKTLKAQEDPHKMDFTHGDSRRVTIFMTPLGSQALQADCGLAPSLIDCLSLCSWLEGIVTLKAPCRR